MAAPCPSKKIATTALPEICHLSVCDPFINTLSIDGSDRAVCSIKQDQQPADRLVAVLFLNNNFLILPAPNHQC